MTNVLEQRRNDIDVFNFNIIKLLSVRAQTALSIASIKKQQDLPIEDSSREEQIMKFIEQHNEGPFSNDDIKEIFKLIIKKTKQLEECQNA